MKTDKKCFDGSYGEYGSGPQTVLSGIVDFHSHVLPGMDDGARNEEEAIAMLSVAYRQGIRIMVATPHFYADRESPEEFLARRNASVQRLLRGGYSPEKGYPDVYLGAEVAFFAGMSRSPQLPSLCIGGGKGLLIEMPFARWSDGVINEVIAIREAFGLCPVIAHIERYLGYQKRGTLGRLIEGGALIQSNAEYFTEKKTSKKAMKLLMQGGINLLGSDAHGLTERVPNLGEGLMLIDGCKYGEQLLIDIVECSRYILKKAEPIQLETANA